MTKSSLDTVCENPETDAKGGISTPILILLSAILAFIWGGAFTMVGVGVRYITPAWLVAGRLFIGALGITLYALSRGHRFPNLRDPRWKWYFSLGMTGMVIPFLLLSIGQLSLDSGLTAIITGVMPLITIILAHYIIDERLTRMKLLGFFIGFIGIVILFLPDNFSLELVRDWKAQLLILGAATGYAVTTVLAKRAPKTPSAIGAAMMLICGFMVSFVIALASGIPSAVPPVKGLLMVVGLGLGSTGIATVLYLYIIEQTGPTVLAKINYFTPVVSVILGAWLLHEPLTWRLAISGIVVILGVMIARIKPKNIQN